MIFNLFSKKNPFSFDFETLYTLFKRLVDNYGAASIKVKQQKGSVNFSWYQLPGSFKNSDLEVHVLQQNNFENFYQALNKIYEIAEINPVSIEEAIENDYQYDLMQIDFDIFRKDIELWTNCSFYFFFVRENDASEMNNYRVLYHQNNDGTLQSILDSKRIENLNNPNQEDVVFVEQLEKSVAAFSEFLGIENPLTRKHPQLLVDEKATVEDFHTLLSFMNYNKDAKDHLERASILLEQYNDDWNKFKQYDDLEDVDPEYLQAYEDYEFTYFPWRYDLLDEESTWLSDWKFDPEDAEYFINEIIGENCNFDFPENTFSHDLFPYIQKKLSSKGLELMNMNTEGDDYQFFIAKKENVETLLELSNKLDLGLECLS